MTLLSNVLLLAGLISLTVAAFLASSVAGFACVGVSLLFVSRRMAL